MYNNLKKAVKKIFNRFGVDIIRYNIHTSREVLLKTIFEKFKIKTVLDVGANIGEYGVGLFESGYSGQVYSFEPITSVYETLRKKTKLFPRWEAFNEGIGATQSEMMINVSRNLVSSSLLQVGSITISAEPETQTSHQEKIKISTIDSFFSTHRDLTPGIWLKLDVQGYELHALKGAVKAMPQIDVIQVELSFAQVYDAAPLYQEIIDYLRTFGFELYSIIPEFIDSRSGQMLQADGIFTRSELQRV